MTGRRSCPVCDRDGTELIQRDDDSPEVVANRLKTYHQQTEPVVDYYKNNGRTVYDVDANRSADVVSSLVFDELDTIAKA